MAAMRTPPPARMFQATTRMAGLQAERAEVRRRGHAVPVPAAQVVVAVQHGLELLGRTVHARRGAVRNGLVHHTPRQHVVLAPHAFPGVEETLEIDHALTYALELLHAHVPARDPTNHARVGLLHEEAEAALGGEATEHEGIVDGGEVLASHGELRLAVGAAPVVALSVLRRGPRVVMAAPT